MLVVQMTVRKNMHSHNPFSFLLLVKKIESDFKRNAIDAFIREYVYMFTVPAGHEFGLGCRIL